MRRFTLLLVCALFIASASTWAATNRTVNGTIGVTNTFQSVLAASVFREGCVIQNTGTHVMYVYFGVMANATTSNAIQLRAATSSTSGDGGTVTCAIGSIGVATDQVSITGTANDTFIAFEEN